MYFGYLGTAWYRMMPNIKLLDEIKGNDAVLLQSCFPKGVIGLKSVKGMYLFYKINSYYFFNKSNHCF